MVDNSRREDHKPDDRLDLDRPLLSMSTQGCSVEELEHTAEIGLRVSAASRAEAYACMATAMFALTGAMADPAAEQTARTITIRAPDAETLLVDKRQLLTDMLDLRNPALLTDKRNSNFVLNHQAVKHALGCGGNNLNIKICGR